MIPPMSSPEIPDFSTSSVEEKTREKLSFRFAPFLLGLLMKKRGKNLVLFSPLLFRKKRLVFELQSFYFESSKRSNLKMR